MSPQHSPTSCYTKIATRPRTPGNSNNYSDRTRAIMVMPTSSSHTILQSPIGLCSYVTDNHTLHKLSPMTHTALSLISLPSTPVSHYSTATTNRHHRSDLLSSSQDKASYSTTLTTVAWQSYSMPSSTFSISPHIYSRGTPCTNHPYLTRYDQSYLPQSSPTRHPL